MNQDSEEANSQARKRPTREPLLANSSQKNKPAKIKLDTLTRLQIIGYGLGHFQNDLVGAIWFNYLLYFMKNVIFAGGSESGFYTGLVLLSGQIADGIATPLVGYYSDKTNTRIGKRTPWYIFGSIVVSICFVFIFQSCLLCQWFDVNSSWLLIFYYSVIPASSNIGWACVQVSHMSLVPSLTLSRRTRDKLNNLRNTFTYIANLYVLILAFFVFLFLSSATEQFNIITFTSTGLGALTSIFFLATVNEKKLTADCRRVQKEFKKKYKISVDPEHPTASDKLDKIQEIADESQGTLKEVQSQFSPISPENEPGKAYDFENWELSEDEKAGDLHQAKEKRSMTTSKISMAEEIVHWRQWFSHSAFYIYGFVYMAVRLLVNVQSSMIIFYLQNVLGISKGTDTSLTGLPIEFAIIPIIIYLSSSIMSTLLKFVYPRIGRKKTFLLGTFAAVSSSIAMMFLDADTKNIMYGIAVLLGIGQSISLNTGITLIGEVVGIKGSSGAFVFGAYSLLDKFANGIVLYLIINLKDPSDASNGSYIRICTSIIPGVASLLAAFLIVIGKAADYDSGDNVMDQHNQKESTSQGVN